MKRKVAKIGPATLMVALPAKWAKQFSVQKGDEVDIQEKNSSLIVSTSKTIKKAKKVINVSELPKIFVVKSIVSLYKQGYHDIKVLFRNKQVKDLKFDKVSKTEDVLQEAVTELVGFEIIEQKTDSIRIKDIASPSPQEFENVLRRIFLLIQSYTEESLQALKGNDKDLLLELSKRKNNVSRFTNYALRLLSTGSAASERSTDKVTMNSSVMYTFITQLYDITDVFWFINKELTTMESETISSEAKAVYEHVHNSFRNLYNIFYKFDREKVEEIFIDRRKCIKKINEIKKSDDKNSIILTARLVVALNLIYRMAESVIGMQEF